MVLDNQCLQEGDIPESILYKGELKIYHVNHLHLDKFMNLPHYILFYIFVNVLQFFRIRAVCSLNLNIQISSITPLKHFLGKNDFFVVHDWYHVAKLLFVLKALLLRPGISDIVVKYLPLNILMIQFDFKSHLIV